MVAVITEASKDLIISQLSEHLRQIEKRLTYIESNENVNENAFFMCSMALIIFLMQCGFAFLEAGAVRSKNTTNILIKNLLDSCLAVIGYYCIGWAFAYGPGTPGSTWNLFIGYSQFFLAGVDNYSRFFFQYVFAATSATIVSGAVAERCEFATYITYCTVISSFVYPILTHWGWADGGWMKNGINTETIHTTYIDNAGSGVVHLCGGAISFLAAYMMGPRHGRFATEDEEESIEIKGHSVPFAALGGFILMFGFLAFNGGSVAEIVRPGDGPIVALAMTNTILSGAFAAMIFLVIHYIWNGKWTLLLTINACLAGMVAACAGCNRMMPWGSAFVGVGAGLIYLGLSKLMIKLKIDDPLDAFAVHAGGGFWGLIAVCIIAPDGIAYSIVNVINGTKDKYSIGQAFAQLGWNIICAIAIITWSIGIMGPVFSFLKIIKKFRVSYEVETKGLDIYKHGEAAYPLHAYGHGWDEFENIKANEDNKKNYSNHTRKMSVHQEISMEELAEAYQRRSSVAFDLGDNTKRKYSLYTNPKQFEHPEHHHKAKQKKHFTRNKIKPIITNTINETLEEESSSESTTNTIKSFDDHYTNSPEINSGWKE
ncbi:Ammonium transporter family and Ammonium transporter AmtB-like domain-containing protein [Strongyloides ratti]|uniref:Ammonium transporter n=1 Tax=Strongyloides ratti TaxID=34506 RepID=A0A090LPJ5_STRRB|nr:Ammonium transporter family and Ammonium transporter AmtB-like domain-containing protein [Strongyloides ratti]CEF71676.1 Ammonium transporter family and Ammonium transporter AmtB-like domain-containing protein [Strongyloides ratti]